MSEFDRRMERPVSAGLLHLTHLVYLLHGFSVLMGILGPAFIITAFLTGWPSIIAVILNYAKRSDVRGSWLDSHFGWQIRTFWYTLLWLVIAALLFATIIGIVLAYILVVGTGFWVAYRLIRGWLALTDGRSMPM